MPNVLLIAYACEPGRGSEWGTSWAFVHEMARHQPVWVIAHADNRARLDEHLRTKHAGHPIHVTYVELPRWLGWMRNSTYALLNVHYYFWQLAARRAVRKLHDKVRLDVVQHISYSRWWMPSAGAALSKLGVRFIFGPCVGGEQVPRAFRKAAPWKVRWGEFQRLVARTMWARDPLLKRTIQDADIVVAGTPASVEGVTRYGPKRVEVMPSVMITDTTLIDLNRAKRLAYRPDKTLRIVSVGGVIYYRGVNLILRAIKQSGIEDFHFTHCCGGEMLEQVKQLAVDLGIADRVTFTGKTKHAENLGCVANADVMAHIVLRDSQGVVPEALALGVPVLALDHHSMSPVIDASVGHKIPMPADATPDSIVDDAARVLRHWYDNRHLLPAMAQACIRRSQELSPAHRVGIFRSWHAELTANNANAVSPQNLREQALFEAMR